MIERVTTTAEYVCNCCGLTLETHERRCVERLWTGDGEANLQNAASSNTSVYYPIPTDDGWGATDTPHSSEITPIGDIQVLPPDVSRNDHSFLPVINPQPVGGMINPPSVQPTPTAGYAAPWKANYRRLETEADLRR